MVALVLLLAYAATGGRAIGAGVATRVDADGADGVGVVATIPIGQELPSIAVDPAVHRVYVPLPESESVLAIDTDNTASRVRIKVGRHPEGLALDATAQRLYATNADDDTVSVVDASDGSLVGTLPTGARPRVVALDAERGLAYVGDDGDRALFRRTANPSGTVTVASIADRRAVASVPLGSNNELTVVDDVAVDPACGRAYVAASRKEAGALYGIPGEVAVDPAQGKTFVASDPGELLAFRGGCRGVLQGAAQKISVGGRPKGLALDRVARVLYVANYLSNSVSVVDALADRVLTTVGVDQNPLAVAVDESTHTAYVASEGSGAITVVRGVDRRVATGAEASGADAQGPSALPSLGGGGRPRWRAGGIAPRPAAPSASRGHAPLPG